MDGEAWDFTFEAVEHEGDPTLGGLVDSLSQMGNRVLELDGHLSVASTAKIEAHLNSSGGGTHAGVRDGRSGAMGQRAIALDFRPEQVVSASDPDADPIEIPSVPSPLAEVGAKLTNLVDKIADNDLSAIIGSLEQTLDEIREFISSPELPALLRSIDRRLAAGGP
ncbi:MAG: hypothetical protein IH968_04885 [Gemmatimonadetes bacterium]|nr:hypothetical protein [Gemmatimonadota bacterium]